jgi:hypothetical protein
VTTLSAACAAGSTAVGGGYELLGASAATPVPPVGDHPTGGVNLTGWNVSFLAAQNFSVYVICSS